MFIKFDRPINAYILIRRLGYKPWGDGFTRRLSDAFYPRFHIRLVEGGLDLHFDWRKPMHKKGIRSTEEGESEVVQKEVQRIIDTLKNL